ncbi:DUF1456 family protein [Alginatibacterium sediminis]|uniref:DUF1456 family protein n=1 Tax=Alginatibacterium sediminis TaxID=2164068 RepID=A0A420EI09_9ALTE|nr:DUF1456 family protein [Alginatibacterium sediminis]RKF20294.1 DUF1456 family protein [Alginatibacterium sediminis]
MIHNDILRRLRYALNLNDAQMIEIFALSDYEIEKSYMLSIMLKEGEEGFLPCRDAVLELFLDGLIIKMRGKQEGKERQGLKPGERLSNNDILRKLRIALNMREDDLIATLKLADFNVGRSELSALFRKSTHRNYVECGDQLLRNFLNGLSKRP